MNIYEQKLQEIENKVNLLEKMNEETDDIVRFLIERIDPKYYDEVMKRMTESITFRLKTAEELQKR